MSLISPSDSRQCEAAERQRHHTPFACIRRRAHGRLVENVHWYEQTDETIVLNILGTARCEGADVARRLLMQKREVSTIDPARVQEVDVDLPNERDVVCGVMCEDLGERTLKPNRAACPLMQVNYSG